MKHDAWMSECFWHAIRLVLGPLEPRNTCRLYCAMTVHVKMWRVASVSVFMIEWLEINVSSFSFTKWHIERRIHNRFRF